MGAWLKWYLERFGSRDFIGVWLAWMGFLTVCVIEIKRAFVDAQFQFSPVFTTVLGGVVGFLVRGRSDSKGDEKLEKQEGSHGP